jgi:hypothetical protein
LPVQPELLRGNVISCKTARLPRWETRSETVRIPITKREVYPETVTHQVPKYSTRYAEEEVVRHVTWFVGAVENFRFFDVKLYPFADPEGAVAEFKAEGLIKPTGRIYRQDYVLFLRAVAGRIAFLREYVDPVRAAKALDARIRGLES